MVGFVVLGAASIAYAVGNGTLGGLLGLLVAALALLAAMTGFCTGCEAYKLAAASLGGRLSRARIPPPSVSDLALADVESAGLWPGCSRPRFSWRSLQ